MTDQQPQRTGCPVISSTGAMLAAAWPASYSHGPLLTSCNAAWWGRSSVFIPQAVLGQLRLSPRLNSDTVPPESTNIFKRVFAGEQVEVVFSESALRRGKTSGWSPQTICERSPTSKFMNTCAQAHSCLHAIVGFGLGPVKGKHF